MFITIEGGDGAGKSTQVQRLAEFIRSEHGRKVVLTREPGGTTLGVSLRELILFGEDIDPTTEALLYAADRAHHVGTVVRDALRSGAIVISDRYVDSSIAYQGAGRGLGEHRIRDLNAWATAGLTPDLTVVLDIDPEQMNNRLVRDLDRLERAGLELHQTTRQAFLDLAQQDPHRYVVIDAGGTIDEVAAQIQSVVSERLTR